MIINKSFIFYLINIKLKKQMSQDINKKLDEIEEKAKQLLKEINNMKSELSELSNSLNSMETTDENLGQREQPQEYINNNEPQPNINYFVPTITVRFKPSNNEEYTNIIVPNNITMGELIIRYLKQIGREKTIIQSKELFKFLYNAKSFNKDSQEIVSQIINPNNPAPIVVSDPTDKLYQSLLPQ